MHAQSAKFQHSVKRNRSGSALVWLLIVLGLAFVVYAVQWYLKGSRKDPDLCYDLAPWKEWRLRETSTKPPQEPSEEQPNIIGVLRFDTNARFQDEPRGEITLSIFPDGSVAGRWYGQYYKKKKINFDIFSADFEGKTYPRKIYLDEDGEDPSKLYFITKGKFVIQESNFEKGGLKHRAGDIYVTGWLNTDKTAMGEITITSNEKYSETFDWKASRPEKSTIFDLIK